MGPLAQLSATGQASAGISSLNSDRRQQLRFRLSAGRQQLTHALQLGRLATFGYRHERTQPFDCVTMARLINPIVLYRDSFATNANADFKVSRSIRTTANSRSSSRMRSCSADSFDGSLLT